ncbi:ABC transporter substrate-binding protein [Thermodesulfobacteriota bacterium]
MILSKKVLRKRCGFQPAFACTLGVLAAVLVIAGTGAAAGKPKTVAELALYKGGDRQQILEAGAKQEGKLLFYTSGILKQAVRPVVSAFEKKYPFIKVQIWRAGNPSPKALEEYRAGAHLFDALESTRIPPIAMLLEGGVVQPFYSPNLAHTEEDAITRAPGGGALAAGTRVSGIVLAYNTKLVAKEDVPKTYRDLLDAKWKGKVAIVASGTGVKWAGIMLDIYGEDFLKQIAEQNFAVHMTSGRALLDMIIAGEYALSPTIFDSHVLKSKQSGAPIDWQPLEPVYVNLGQICLSKHAPNPHAALLFIDFELTKESANIHKAAGYSTVNKDVPPLAMLYKKYYGGGTMAELKRWTELFNSLFLKK